MMMYYIGGYNYIMDIVIQLTKLVVRALMNLVVQVVHKMVKLVNLVMIPFVMKEEIHLHIIMDVVHQ